MDFTYHSNKILLYDKNSNMLAEVTFPDIDDYTVNVDHTYVDDSLGGQGIAGQLMLAMAEQIRQQQKRAVLTCSYAKHWFSKHPEYDDIIIHKIKSE